MFPVEQINIIKLIVNTSLGIKPGENVLFVADHDENVEIAAQLAAEARSVGAEAAIIVLGPRKGLHHEPPRSVAEAMKHADVVLGVMHSLLHTKARREAQAAGARFAIMGGVKVGKGKDYLAGLDITPQDVHMIEERSATLAQKLTRAKTARITSERGTLLELSLVDREGLAVVPVCRDPKTFAILVDYAEVTCAPVEDTAEGVLVIDGTVWGLQDIDRVVEEPITLKINRGRIVDISGGKDARDLEALLARVDPNGRAVAELGIGTNHKIVKLIGHQRDKANLGTIHVAIGKNDFIGGKQDSEIHIDLMVTKPTLDLDGLQVIDRGKLNS